MTSDQVRRSEGGKSLPETCAAGSSPGEPVASHLDRSSTVGGPEKISYCVESDCNNPATDDGWCLEHYRYFSNGTEGMIWMNEWCDRCTRDHFARTLGADSGKGCPLILKSLWHERIPEWMEMDDGVDVINGKTFPRRKLVCINFKGYGEGGGEPKPKPVPPGQGQMFDPPSGPRMLSPLESEKPKVQVKA